MRSVFEEFTKYILNKESKYKLDNTVKEYSYLYITNKLEREFTLIQNITNSNVIMINHYDHIDGLHFIIVFRKTVLIVKNTFLKNLGPLFETKDEIKICFYEGTKSIFDENINIKYKESEKSKFFTEEISEISKNFFNYGLFRYKEFLKNIKLSISGYLIQQSYSDLYYDQTKDFYTKSTKEIKSRKITIDEIIELRTIGTGSISIIVLCYYIKYEKLVIIKKYSIYDSENDKLLKREIENYEKINHPFIPKFYGTIQYQDLSYLVIEFINGKTLLDADLSQFSEAEIYEIILQMILIINYLHSQHFIYRDLKPNNAIIDENKNIVLIDFDRMINDNYINYENVETAEFPTKFAAPELNSNSMTNKCDIYSIGKMIEFIMNKNRSLMKNYKNTELFQIHKKCINDKPELRPNSSELFIDFIYFINENHNIDYNKYNYYFSLAANQNHPEAQFYLGLIYYEGQYIKRDINKFIYYFSLAANQNHPGAQFYLGLIYYEGKYIKRDINKSIYYYSLAANQNRPEAQYNLGLFYYEGKYIKRDINKSIYYYSLAANQNYPNAQYNLGLIYYEGQYIKRDINKSIHYFSLAANQNHPEAQYNLGLIYYEGQYIKRDINKSIYYFSLAANQNYPNAQYNLGLIYYLDQYISLDISKTIYYFSLAANQNIPEAQYNLGFIYYEGQYIKRDINKSIYYFSLAANQNDPGAKFYLGFIYYSGKYIKRNISKSIYYFSLAANQNVPVAKFYLGLIYYSGKYIKRDINKSIHYFSLAANQNDPEAQFYLGEIF